MQRKPKSFIQELNHELRQGLIRSFALGLMLLSIAFLAGSYWAFNELFVRMAWLSASTVIVCVMVIWMTQRNYLDAASFLALIFLWLLVTAGVYTAGGFAAPIFAGYLIVILIGWILLGRRGGLTSLILSVLSTISLFYADRGGLLPVDITYSMNTRLAVGIFFMFVVFLLQRGAAEIIRGTMRQARESESRYRTLLENIPSITYINDLSYDARTLYVSPQVYHLLGYSNDEFIKNPDLWKQILFPLDAKRVMDANRHSVDQGDKFNLEYRLICDDGRVIWVRDEAILVKDEDGEPQYWLGVWTDITSIKNAEEDQGILVNTLVKRNTQLQTASEVSGKANSILDLNALLNDVVELIRDHFGYYYVGVFLTEPDGKYATLRAATGEAGRMQIEAGHALEVGNSSMIGWCIINDQARIALDVGEDAVHFKNPILPLTRSELALPLRSRGEVIGAMTIQSAAQAAFSQADITVLQTMADQIANSIVNARLFNERSSLIAQLEQRNAELERFAYTASHDLKAPLVTISGFLGYLRKDAELGDLNRFDKDLQRIQEATAKMEELLSDLLELSRVGRVINTPEDVPMNQIIQEAMSLVVDSRLHARIRFVVQEDLPVVRADRVRIIEVYQNLISNAIKFMGVQANPKIEIGMDQNGRFYVRDNGMGIDPRFHEQIFGLFNRLHMEIEGTGIGLALVRRIIEVHGGRVWVESQGGGQGSTFYFTLPQFS